MQADPQFLTEVAIAVGTLLAVVVALFLRELRGWLRPPVLELALSKERGHVTGTFSPDDSRYYHLKVSNPRRKFDSVHGVRVTLLRLERKGPDGEYHETWSGSVPLQWRFENPETPPEVRTIGTWDEIDLCSVIRGHWMSLHPTIHPKNLTETYAANRDPPFDLALTVQARGEEVDSKVCRWRVFWDGKWKDGDAEMLGHFHVSELSVLSGWRP